jgi:3-hydroxyisobutyrate dehydrogenase
MIRKIGFVGLGAIGMPMAKNLVKAGFDVHGYDMRPEAVATLAAEGGVAASSAAAAAKEADLLILMVVNAAQAEAVLFDAGAAAALPDQGVVALMSTCPPAAVAEIARRVGVLGRRFVDAPVSGGVAGARAAALSIMTAGPEALIEEVRPALAALGNRIFHVGERPGQGAAVKTVNQLLCGVHIAAAAEALALAERMGVDPEVALRILGGSSAASWMLNDRGPRMLEANPEVTSAVDIFVKDLGIVMEAGRDAKAALPIAALAHQLFLSTSGRGEGGFDDSQVVRTYRAITNTSAH